MKSTKVCSKCKKELPYGAFQASKLNKSGLRSWCRSCHNKDINDRKKRYVESLKTQGCALCGYRKCYDALEFHHVEERLKNFALSGNGMRGKTNSQIADELALCILLCSNCHREIHYRRIH